MMMMSYFAIIADETMNPIQPRIHADERESEKLKQPEDETAKTPSWVICPVVCSTVFGFFFRSALHPRKSAADSFLSFSICSAAFRPGAPMMPPPGCVAEPHM